MLAIAWCWPYSIRRFILKMSDGESTLYGEFLAGRTHASSRSHFPRRAEPYLDDDERAVDDIDERDDDFAVPRSLDGGRVRSKPRMNEVGLDQGRGRGSRCLPISQVRADHRFLFP